ncbi:MAG: DUF4139 domain-containing protein [Bacteroidota bacterium]
MKNTAIFLLLPFLVCAQSSNSELRVETPVKAVTLYLDGAEVAQQKAVSLNAGVTTVIFTNLSSKLIPKSIQVNVGEGVSVLSITEKLNFLSPGTENFKLKRLKDSLKNNQYQALQLGSDKDAYEKEKELLAKNNSIGSQEKGVSIAELKLAADFYRVRIKEINTEILKLDTKINDFEAVTTRLQHELGELNSGDNRPTGEISILLQTDVKTATNIDLKYVVSDAGWAPFYELKAEDLSKPITLVYRARAFNNSGINWNDVKVKLSTSDPTRNAAKPMIAPWYLNFHSNPGGDGYGNPQQYQNSQISNENLENQSDKRTMSDAELKSWDSYQKKLSKVGEGKVKYEDVQVSELSAEFEIKKTYSIPSDARPYFVEVTTYSLNATFKHFSIPKAEKNAFLLARITGWEDLDLIEGPANVYFGGAFVGPSYINPRSVNDTLDLSFGRDNRVLVTRTKIKDFNKENVSGANRKLYYSYQIFIKNNRKSPVYIDVEDQLPVSQNSEIVVDEVEISKGLVNKDDGKVSWKFLVPPGESQKITFTYSIKYPRNRRVQTEKQFRKIRGKF